MTLARKVTCSTVCWNRKLGSNDGKEIYDDLEIPSAIAVLDELSPTDQPAKSKLFNKLYR
jgi:hypothetical protein